MPQPFSKLCKSPLLHTIAIAERTLRGGFPKCDSREVRNFLFLQFESPLGSIVHATPTFEALKQTIPDAHISVAASSMAAAVLGHNPYVDRCVATASPFDGFVEAGQSVGRLFRSMPAGPRCVITTIGNQRTRVALLVLAAGGALRAGYTLAPELYDFPLRFEPERGQIQGNLDILRSLGHSVPNCEPRMFFTERDSEYALALLQANARADVPRIVFVTQNSGGQRNQWVPERFQRVIAELTRQCGAVPVFSGTAGDAPAIDSLRESLPDPGISTTGKTTIPQLAAILAQCDLAVSLDTGTFHVARAVGLPGVVLSPAWQSPLEWLPVDNPQYRVLRGKSIAKLSPGYAIQEISAEEVIGAALDLLLRFPPSSTSRNARVERSTARNAVI